MKLFQRIFFAAVLSGLVAGISMSALQQWQVTPLILAAEVYEDGAADGAVAHEHASAVGSHESEEATWAPQDGTERLLYTVLANLLAAIGFALLLAAVSVLSGISITARNGVLWGLAGFVVFQLAPAFSLPPELPAMPAADLVGRQIWWWGCALATATAIFGVARFQNWPAVTIAIVLMLLPHVIGAPQLAGEHQSSVPAGLATQFVTATLFVGAAFWLCLGHLLGWLDERFARGVSVAVPA
ncbi:MAG: CbtA family protein [Devosia sp.]